MTEPEWDTEEPVDPPLWVWDDLPDDVYVGLWREFAAWVAWLEDTYGAWVTLPPCWPLHEALRTELTMFWYWHGEIMSTEQNPVAGISWHNDLRNSAVAWRELAGCDHEEPIRYHRQLAEDRRRRHSEFLERAIGEARVSGWRHVEGQGS